MAAENFDRSRWHPCTSIWCELPGRSYERTATPITDPVFVKKYGPFFYTLRLEYRCQAGRANAGCTAESRSVPVKRGLSRLGSIPGTPCISLEWRASPGSFMGVWCSERRVRVSCR